MDETEGTLEATDAGDEGDGAERTSPPGPWIANAVPGPEAPPAHGTAYRSVGFTISSIGYEIARVFRELLQPYGLEPREFALLRAVGFTEGRSQQALGEQLKIPASRMVAFVDALEQRGLLERRQNPSDRRARAIFLTDEGRALMQQAFATAAAHERRLCADLDATEREQLLELLGRVGAQLGLTPGAHSASGHPALADE